MRRWLAILFLLILPLQSSWAAVSLYCQHENGAAAEHLGHHAHPHQAGADDASGTEGSGSDSDCSFCHAASCMVLPVGTSIPPFGIALALPRAEPRPWPLAGLPAEPERPKWRLPA